MKFLSTRAASQKYSLSAAISQGLASDGGLFVPEYLPKVDLASFNMDDSYAQFAGCVLKYFFIDDVLFSHLSDITQAVFKFKVPLAKLNDNTFMLELFHGPTSSFKDFGTTFLAESFSYLETAGTRTIMVATSGDTGAAVASAFYDKPNMRVIILYPKDKIALRQLKQITCWDKNVYAFAVDGPFDRCQQLVKAAFHDAWWQKEMHLNSANSINIGRLLPQLVYYAHAALSFYKTHRVMPGVIIPTGNLGNAVAAYYAKAMGFPIREIVLATNANQTIVNFLRTGCYEASTTIATLANAMDVGHPSNFERLHYLFPDFAAFKQNVRAFSASDEAIKTMIAKTYQQYGKIICPHTATAFYARTQLDEAAWLIVATADASKFIDVIEPIIGRDVPTPQQLQTMLDKRTQKERVVHSLDELKAYFAKDHVTE